MNKLAFAVKSQEDLLRYVLKNEWKTDIKKKQLEAIIDQIQSACEVELDLNEFIVPEQQELQKSFIFERQQKIREINRDLQEVLHQQVEIKQQSQCVLAQLPPRLKKTKESYIHSYNLFKNNLMEMQNCFMTLNNYVLVTEDLQPIKKQINLLQIAENFKFEIRCLESELNQNRQLLGDNFYQFNNRLETVLDNKILQRVISYCTAITKIKLNLKKQKLLAKQFSSFDIESLLEPECEKENEMGNYSQETDITQKSPNKSNDHQIQQNVRDEACLCQIF